MTATAEITDRITLREGEQAVLARDGSDAHLRLAVLLALQAPACDDRQIALSPETSWTSRREALLGALRRRQQPLALIDPDVLYLGHTPEDFQDMTGRRERDQAFRLILDLWAEKGWRLLRTSPRGPVTRELSQREVVAPPREDEEALLPRLSPDLRPLVRWLVGARQLDARTLRALVDEAEDPEEALFSLFEDVAGFQTTQAVRRLSFLREIHPLNGVAGPFGPEQAGLLQVPAHILSRTKASGALATLEDEHRFWMPTALRKRMALRFEQVEPDAAQALRLALANALAGQSETADLEAHRQAVLAEDEALAFQTARFFVSDLRHIAIRCSARKTLTGYRDAARIYRRILQSDPTDAYAHHYLAYNLERAESPDQDAIRGAYQASCDLTNRVAFNPLYHGRRLAFQLKLGQNVRPELDQRLTQTIEAYGTQAASWLILPVRRTMQPNQWAELLRTFPLVEHLRKLPSPRPAQEV